MANAQSSVQARGEIFDIDMSDIPTAVHARSVSVDGEDTLIDIPCPISAGPAAVAAPKKSPPSRVAPLPARGQRRPQTWLMGALALGAGFLVTRELMRAPAPAPLRPAHAAMATRIERLPWALIMESEPELQLAPMLVNLTTTAPQRRRTTVARPAQHTPSRAVRSRPQKAARTAEAAAVMDDGTVDPFAAE
jgi:hypothetical protein